MSNFSISNHFIKICLLCIKIFLLPVQSAFAQSIDQKSWQFSHVVDGDTVAFLVPELPEQIRKISVRIYGVDTPESNHLAKCERERLLGTEVKDFIKRYAEQSGKISAVVFSWDKYGGRVLGDVLFDNKSLHLLLLEKNLAKPYFGGTKSNWCLDSL